MNPAEHTQEHHAHAQSPSRSHPEPFSFQGISYEFRRDHATIEPGDLIRVYGGVEVVAEVEWLDGAIAGYRIHTVRRETPEGGPYSIDQIQEIGKPVQRETVVEELDRMRIDEFGVTLDYRNEWSCGENPTLEDFRENRKYSHGRTYSQRYAGKNVLERSDPDKVRAIDELARGISTAVDAGNEVKARELYRELHTYLTMPKE